MFRSANIDNQYAAGDTASMENTIADLNGPAAAAVHERGGAVELEIRFDGSSWEVFHDLYRHLMAGVSDGTYAAELEHSINTIQDVQNGNRSNSKSQRIYRLGLLPDGRREKTYYIKARISRIVRVQAAAGVTFRVALSSETPISEFAIGAVKFRLKNRISFVRNATPGVPHALDNWRVDMTIVRELDGSMRESITGIARDLFGINADKTTSQTPENVLECLGLRGAKLPAMAARANQATHRYEVEAEYVGERGNVTPDGINAAARALMHMVNPDCLTATQIQSELARVAGHFMSSIKAIQKFKGGEWGLKQLTPQAIGLTTGEYGGLYPPVGVFVSDKAHGIHALLVIREGRLILIAPGWGAGRPGVGDISEAYFPTLAQPLTEGATIAETARLTSVTRAAVMADTVIDGELIPLSHVHGGVRARSAGAHPGAASFEGLFMAFDVIMVNGVHTAGQPFEERIAAVPDAVEVARHFGVIDIRPKPFIRMGDASPGALRRDFTTMYVERKRPYDIDGLVLYMPGHPYANTKIFKWKPLAENSIDFLARRPDKSVLGRAPFVDIPGHTLFFLFVGVSSELYRRLGLALCTGYGDIFPEHVAGRNQPRSDYFPVQFQPADQPYAFLYYHPDKLPDGSESAHVEGRIIELRLRGGDPAGADAYQGTRAPNWELMRVRTDRDEDLQRGRLFGNNFVTAVMGWLNYRSPLTFEMLSDGPDGYFRALKQGIYDAPTRFMSHAKHEVMSAHIAGSPFVVDLGAGRGADLNRYRRLQVPTVVVVDSDSAALVEFSRRMITSRSKERGARGRSTRFHALQGDFSAAPEELVDRIRGVPGFPAEGASSVVCNLAAHYAFGSDEGITNFATLCHSILRPGGQLTLTLLDGAAVFKLLKSVPVGDSWDAREGGVLKYSIRRMYQDNKLTSSGQQIGVVLPFSRGEYYTEFLSNIAAVSRIFRKIGLKHKFTNNLMRCYGESFSTNLTGDDMAWLSMFVAVRFERV
jgi:hypothetical protein